MLFLFSDLLQFKNSRAIIKEKLDKYFLDRSFKVGITITGQKKIYIQWYELVSDSWAPQFSSNLVIFTNIHQKKL